MTEEEWRKVPSEPHYEVSNLGRVRSLDHTITVILKNGTVYTRQHKGKIIKGALQQGKYLDVSMNKRRRSLAHLILEAFVGPRPSPEHEGRHLNDDQSNYRLENLAWGTKQDNATDRAINKVGYRPIGELHHGAKVTEEIVRQIRLRYIPGPGGIGRLAPNSNALAKEYNISQRTVRDIALRKTWTHVT